MTRTDSLVVGTLVVLLALIAGLVGIPPLLPVTATTDTPAATADPIALRPYREGVLGRPVSVSPFSARTQADRDLVALVFAGLVRNGPLGTLVPDLAERWTVDGTGAVWTFQLRDDARWHDGEPVTADDVAFTIHVLQDPQYTGPGARSWNEVTVTTDGPLIVSFHLKTPLGGFLQAATQPIAPAHILQGIPVTQLAERSFSRQPIGSGPFAVASLSDDAARLIPAVNVLGPDQPTDGSGPHATDSLATLAPATRPDRPVPYLAEMDFSFFDDPEALAAAYRQGGLDAASGLSPGLTRDLAEADDSRALRYPGSTLTAVLFNLRPGHPQFANPAVRTALLAAIDRPTIVTGAFAMAARPGTGPIPPSSALYDPAADPAVPYDPTAATAALKKAGWTLAADGWHLPNAKSPIKFELLSPDQASNPAAFETASIVARDWSAIGLDVTHVPLPPGEFVTGRLATGKFMAAVADVTIGIDPDLYPLLASSQTVTGGSNVIGLQDPALDALLVKARGPGTTSQRMTAYSALQVQLAKGRYVLPLAFADESIVVRDTLQGPSVSQVADSADRFWDVLTWRLAAGR
ncbi:MAG: ABC transporter substrate-binding protein [Chloroflexota bacterium]